MRHHLFPLLILLVAQGVALPVFAQELATTDTAEPPTPTAMWRLEAGLLTALPAALPVGLSTGVAAGVVHAGTLTWGARASWSQATEYTETWAVTHQEIRLRALGILQHNLGRATIGLQLGLGATVLYESRLRAQAARLGDAGLALNQSAWSALPAADLQAAIALPVVDAFGLTLAGGPSVHLFQGGAIIGWQAFLAANWNL